jgi:hypothetical protein
MLATLMKGLVLSKFTWERQNLHGKFLHSKSLLVRNASIYQYHTMQGTERYLPPMNIASKLGQRFRAEASASPASSSDWLADLNQNTVLRLIRRHRSLVTVRD